MSTSVEVKVWNWSAENVFAFWASKSLHPWTSFLKKIDWAIVSHRENTSSTKHSTRNSPCHRCSQRRTRVAEIKERFSFDNPRNSLNPSLMLPWRDTRTTPRIDFSIIIGELFSASSRSSAYRAWIIDFHISRKLKFFHQTPNFFFLGCFSSSAWLHPRLLYILTYGSYQAPSVCFCAADAFWHPSSCSVTSA